MAKRRLLTMHYDSRTGHIGGNLSCIDALMTLRHCVMKPDDRFILSKGHSAGAWYIALWSQGLIGEEELKTFCQDDSRLGGHPSCASVPHTLFSTGSLGHGPSLAAGLAMAARFQGSNRHVYCLCSDGEWQEGACWEALIFAVHHRLDNLTIMIDQNGLQGFGTTQDVVSISNLASRIAGFGAGVASADGHSPSGVLAGLSAGESGKPHFLILSTIKGKGLPFENTVASHYLPMTEEAYLAACRGMDMELES